MGNIIAGLVVLLIVFLAVRKMYIDKKTGNTCASCGHSCGGSCGHCASAAHSPKKRK